MRISLTLPDSQKMRDDLSLDLDWRVLSGRAGTKSPLMQLVNQKASQAMGTGPIQVLNYFPKDIQLRRKARHTALDAEIAVPAKFDATHPT